MSCLRNPLCLAGLCLGILAQAAPVRAAGWWDQMAARDLSGAPVPLKTRWVVLVFMSVDCPLSNDSIPTVNALAQRFPQATFFAAYEDPDATVEQLKAHATAYRLGFNAIDDRSQSLSGLAKAAYTPEVAVYASDGTLEYRGRIDDKQDDIGQARPSATEHDLADLLKALASGKSGPFPFHPGFGCALPRKVAP